jgi:hypothetical protein
MRPSILGDTTGLYPEAIEARCPMAMTLSERRPIRGMEAADGSREGTPAVEDHALRSPFPLVPENYPADLDSIIISTAELGRRSSPPPNLPGAASCGTPP